MNVDYNTETQEITVELNTPAIEFDTPTGGRGLKGDTGSTGPQGPQGIQGIQGIQGEKGDTGEDGYTPIKGVDYFTEEDIESLNIPTKTSDLNNDSGFITSSSLPTKVSDLQNDTGFITNTVNNLTNYYTSSTTYTKSEVDSLIATVSSLDIEVVQTLPTHDISTSTIYLVPNSSHGTNNYYDEYIYVSNSWELIGSTQVDLSNYYTKTETDTLLGNKQDALVSGTNIKTINGSSILGNGNIDVATDITLSATTENGTWYLQSKKGIYWVTGATKFNLGVGASDLSFLGDKVMMFMQVIDQSDVSALNDGDTVAYAVHFLESTSNSGQIKIYNEYYRIKYDSSKSSKLVYASGNATMLDDIASLTYMNTALGNKQDALVSGTNIKTINNTSLLGSGNIDVSGGGGTPTDVRVNGTSITSNNVADIQTEGTYNSSTNKIATMSDIPTVPTIGNAKTYYGTSSTSASTAAKTATCSGFTLETGATIFIKFSNANSYNGTATLNVNSTGARTICSVGTTETTRYYWKAGEVVGFVYDGTNYVMIEKAPATTTYYGITKLSSSTSSTSEAVAATPKAVKAAYDLANGKQNAITSTNKLDYSLIDNTPTIPTKVSDLTNDSGFITGYTETDPIFSASAAAGITSSDITSWNNKSTFSGNYNDLTNKPTIPDELSDLSDDSTHRLVTDTEKTTWNNKSDFSGSYNDLTNKPTIPTVNDATLTIQKNGTTIDTFTANASSNKTVNVTVPTKVSDLTNDSGFITSYTETDPVFTASAAHGISSSDITNWNGKMDYTEITGNVRVWDLDEGAYVTNGDCVLYYYGASDTTNSKQISVGSIILIADASLARRSGFSKQFLVVSGATGVKTLAGYSTSTAGYCYTLLSDGDIANNLTTSTTGSVLDASQGKALKDTLDATTSTSISNMNNIGTLSNLTTTAQTDLVSAINETNIPKLFYTTNGSASSTPFIFNDMALGIYRIADGNNSNFAYFKGTSSDSATNGRSFGYKILYYFKHYSEAQNDEIIAFMEGVDSYGACEKHDIIKDTNQNSGIKSSSTTYASLAKSSTVGTLSSLTTTTKTDLVSAINEVKGDIPTVPTNVSSFNNDAGYLTSVPVNDVKVNNTSILSSGDANLVTNTAYDSTTNKLATMADIPAVVSPNIMTVYLAADYTIANTNTAYDMLNTAVSSSVGSKLTFSGGKIVIGAGVSKVKVSYTAKSVSAANQTRTFTYLMQDINGVATAMSQEGHWYGGTNWQVVNTYGPITLNVNQGDAFYLRCYGYKNNYIAGAASSFIPTILTVEVIE